MKPIIIKSAVDLEGQFRGLELWQDDQHITLSVGGSSTGHFRGDRWSELQDRVEIILKFMADETVRELQEKTKDA
jgi:hypothetical protein